MDRSYELVIDNGETEERAEYSSQDEALAAFRKACRRDPFSAAVYVDDEQGFRSRLASYGEGWAMNPEVFAEFKRLFREAGEIAYSHDEFLRLVFNAAIKLANGEWLPPNLTKGK